VVSVFAAGMSARARALERSELAALFALAERPEVISFAGGFPDPEWFLPEFREISERIMRDSLGTALQYGPTPGLTPLREFMAERCTGQGIRCRPEDILITSGALQGLDLVCKVFLEKGDIVVMEHPTYIGAIQTISAYEARMLDVPVDENGLDVDALEELLGRLARQGERPKFIYTVPSFQNPSGLTMSLPRRRRLLETASRYGIPVVEDHAYAELRYEGEELPALKALDEEGLVIHLGTFSKIFSPGLRLGWSIAAPPVTEKLLIFKQGTDQCSNSLGQMMAVEYGRRGLIERQIAVTRASLKAKRRLTLEALERHFGSDISYTVPQGGFYTWATLPEGIDTVRMLERAVKEHLVAYVAGPSFYVDRSGQNQLRICFSLVKPELIDEGIRRLRAATEQERSSR